MTEVEKAFQLPTETEVILKIGEIIWKKTESSDDNFSNLTEPERVFIFVEMLEGQINNGGFDQFFFNSSGDYTYKIVSAYETIKAFKTTDLIKNAIKLFPVLPVSKDTKTRRRILQYLDERISEEWDKLDSKFYEYEENIVDLLIEYMKANIELIGRQ
jgi:hypothetical protein